MNEDNRCLRCNKKTQIQVTDDLDGYCPDCYKKWCKGWENAVKR